VAGDVFILLVNILNSEIISDLTKVDHSEEVENVGNNDTNGLPYSVETMKNQTMKLDETEPFAIPQEEQPEDEPRYEEPE
jgi:hypothetical protein